MKCRIAVVLLLLSRLAAALPAEWPEPAARCGDELISKEELTWYCDAVWTAEEQRAMTPPELAARLRLVAGDAAERLRLRRLLQMDGIEVTPELSLERAARFEPDLPQIGAWNPARQLTLALLAWHFDCFEDAEAHDPEQVEAYYRRHQDRYLVAEHRSVQLILISRKLPGGGAEEAASLRARLQQGEPFEKLREAFDRSTEQERWSVLQLPSVKAAVTALDAEKPESTTEILETEHFWVLGRAQVAPAYYLPLDAGLKNRIRLQMQLFDAMERFDRLHPAPAAPAALAVPDLAE